MNLEFVRFFVALDASEAAKFEDWQLAYLDILHLVQFTHMMEKAEPGKKDQKKIIVIVIAILVALLAVLLIMKPWGGGQNTQQGMVWDTNAEVGGLEHKSDEEIQAELNQKVEEGMINISMNTTPVFETGKSKGNLLIVNSEVNNYPQIVYIVRKDNNQEIYRSGGIPVGSKIEYAALDVDLPAGTYDCVAYFNNADPDTGAILGTAGAEITITVNK